MNEFVIKNGFISQGDSSLTGSLNITGGITVTGGITGSISGSLSTAISSSYASTASYVVSSSYALSASWAPGGGITATGSFTGSFTGSLDGTASWANNASTASYVLNAQSSSYYIETDPIFTARSASLATTGSNTFIGNQTIQGNITIFGTASVDILITNYQSSSIVYSSGSTKFGDTLDDTHDFTGSISITGSEFKYNNFNVINSSLTSSMTVLSSSYAQTASYALRYGNDITATATWTFLSEEDTIVNTISNAFLTTTNFKSFTYIPQETTATSLDDFKLNGVTFNIENIIDNTSFDIRATAANNATGVYTAIYKITHT